MSKCERCGLDDPDFGQRGMVVTRDVWAEFPAMMCLPCWREWGRYVAESEEHFTGQKASWLLKIPYGERSAVATEKAVRLLIAAQAGTGLLLDAFISEKPERGGES